MLTLRSAASISRHQNYHNQRSKTIDLAREREGLLANAPPQGNLSITSRSLGKQKDDCIELYEDSCMAIAARFAEPSGSRRTHRLARPSPWQPKIPEKTILRVGRR